MLKSFFAKEIRFDRIVLLFFPVMGAVYCYLSFHAPMRSLIHTAHYPDHWVSTLMAWLMTPGAILLYGVIAPFRGLLGSNLVLSFLFVVCQLAIGFALSFCIKSLFPLDRRGKVKYGRVKQTGRVDDVEACSTAVQRQDEGKPGADR